MGLRSASVLHICLVPEFGDAVPGRFDRVGCMDPIAVADPQRTQQRLVGFRGIQRLLIGFLGPQIGKPTAPFPDLLLHTGNSLFGSPLLVQAPLFLGLCCREAFLRLRFGTVQPLLTLSQLPLPVGAARGGAHKAGRAFRTALPLDCAAAVSPIGQQGGARLQVGLGNAPQAGKNRFPEARFPIGKQTGNRVSNRGVWGQEPVRVFLEQLPDFLQVLPGDHQRI